MKVCRFCKIEKEDKEFDLKHEPSSRTMCAECNRVRTIERQKKTYQKLKAKRIAYQKEFDKEFNKKPQRVVYSRNYSNEWRRNNPDYGKEYRANNKTLIAEKRRLHYKINKVAIQKRRRELYLKRKEANS